MRVALYASKVVAYAQGFDQIQAASDEYGWNIDRGAMARIWRGGCIIRARFLNRITEAYERNPELPTLLVDPYFTDAVVRGVSGWRRVVAQAALAGVPAPAFSSSLAYYDSLRSERLPAALIQGQRDFFGAHTYKRIDKEGTFHTLWSGDRTEVGGLGAWPDDDASGKLPTSVGNRETRRTPTAGRGTGSGRVAHGAAHTSPMRVSRRIVPIPTSPRKRRRWRRVEAFASGATGKLRRSSAGRGIYLDGGFGVGKTHLLAALASSAGARAAFGTFVEYTHLVGALGFSPARDALARFRVVCIDEFELDDPGDTVLMARLMRELADAGVALAATSNTLPDSLGEGRFAADDFRREIQAVAKVFDVVTIDGPDYRHRGDIAFVTSNREAVALAAHKWGGVVESWPALVEDLNHVHPSRLGAYVEGVRYLGLTDVEPLESQSQALRVVSLVDRLYEADVSIMASGTSLGEIFPEEMLRGGYRKKYFRALSRLSAMCMGE